MTAVNIKIQRVVRYQTQDGSLFKSESEALQHERNEQTVLELEKILKEYDGVMMSNRELAIVITNLFTVEMK